ncbi:MAG: hypothetical protein K6B68_02220 [Eubacterium sp.]|nr:hypothetical protein [Eubacterium sp.]
MTYRIGFFVGLVASVIFAIVVILLVCSMMNKDGKIKSKYDERQMIVRGNAYRISMWTLIVLLIIYGICETSGIDIPMENNAIIFLFIMMAVLVHAVYCIFNDGYFGINNIPKAYNIFLFLIGLMNVAIGVMNTVQGRLVEDGKLSMPIMNYICGFMFLIVGIAILIKHFMNKSNVKEDDEEDEEDMEGRV